MLSGMNDSPGRLVLVADDSPIVAEALRELVEEAGAQVLGPAADGTEALRLFLDGAPDIALLDVQMPGMTGIEVTRAIRAAPGGERCLVIVVTSSREPEVRRHALAAGADHFLLKGELHRVVDLLSARNAGDAPPGAAPDGAPAPPVGK